MRPHTSANAALFSSCRATLSLLFCLCFFGLLPKESFARAPEIFEGDFGETFSARAKPEILRFSPENRPLLLVVSIPDPNHLMAQREFQELARNFRDYQPDIRLVSHPALLVFDNKRLIDLSTKPQGYDAMLVYWDGKPGGRLWIFNGQTGYTERIAAELGIARKSSYLQTNAKTQQFLDSLLVFEPSEQNRKVEKRLLQHLCHADYLGQDYDDFFSRLLNTSMKGTREIQVHHHSPSRPSPLLYKRIRLDTEGRPVEIARDEDMRGQHYRILKLRYKEGLLSETETKSRLGETTLTRFYYKRNAVIKVTERRGNVLGGTTRYTLSEDGIFLQSETWNPSSQSDIIFERFALAGKNRMLVTMDGKTEFETRYTPSLDSLEYLQKGQALYTGSIQKIASGHYRKTLLSSNPKTPGKLVRTEDIMLDTKGRLSKIDMLNRGRRDVLTFSYIEN